MSITFRREVVLSQLLDPRQNFETVTHQMEFRYDPLTGRSTRLAHFGGIKPQPLRYEDYDGDNKGFCPFCAPQMERITSLFPKELVPEGRLRQGEATLIANIAPYDAYSGLVVLSDKHVLKTDDLTAERLHNAFTLAVEFFGRIRRYDPKVPYYFLGWNYMPPSGGGLVHAHIQVFGSKDPGNVFMDMLQGSRLYKSKTGHSFWQDYLTEEEKLQERYLGRTGDIYWLVPFAPLGVLGDTLAVLPKATTAQDLHGQTLNNLVEGLGKLFSYYRQNGIYSFNASLHFSPSHNEDFPLVLRCSPRTFLNLKFYPPDTNFFHVMQQQPVCVVYPEELARDIRPFFA